MVIVENFCQVPQLRIFGPGFEQHTPAAYPVLRHLDLIKQIGVTIQHFEQLHQG
jgi:hypothetical protein